MNNINNKEWKKIVSKEFISYKETRKKLRESFIKENKKQIKKQTTNKNIFKFKVKKDQDVEIISKSRSFCQNNFCFPIKENFIVPNCYTLKYIELFDNFEFFDKTMSNFFIKISGLYEFYPKTLDEKERLDNKGFILWLFISYIKFLSNNHLNFFNKKEDIVDLIKDMSNMLDKDFKYLFTFLVKYLIKIDDRFKEIKNKNSLSDFFKYRKYYCPICRRYLCKKHFYKSYKDSILQNNDKNYFFIESDNISCYSHEINFLRTNDNFIEDKDENGIVKINELNSVICNKCSDSMIIIDNNENQNNNKEEIIKLFPTMSKDDFYLLNICLLFGIKGNSCFFNKLFQHKYSCEFLKQIITFCNNLSNIHEIDNYLKSEISGFPKYPSIINKDVEAIFENIIDDKISNQETNQELQMKETIKNNFGYLKSKKRGGYHCTHLGNCYNNPKCECNANRSFCDKFCICYKNNCPLEFKGCKCDDKCKNKIESRELSTCACIKEGRECDPEICKNCKHCDNTKAYDGIFKKTKLSQSVIIDGAGLFAAEDIEKNELIDQYVGEVIEKEEVERRSTINIPFERNYAFELDDFYDIDATRYGNKMRYINHSSFGYENCYARNVIVRGNTEILFYAKRNITKGEEIYLDYHMNNCTWLNKYNRLYGKKTKS